MVWTDRPPNKDFSKIEQKGKSAYRTVIVAVDNGTYIYCNRLLKYCRYFSKVHTILSKVRQSRHHSRFMSHVWRRILVVTGYYTARLALGTRHHAQCWPCILHAAWNTVLFHRIPLNIFEVSGNRLHVYISRELILRGYISDKGLKGIILKMPFRRTRAIPIFVGFCCFVYGVRAWNPARHLPHANEVL